MTTKPIFRNVCLAIHPSRLYRPAGHLLTKPFLSIIIPAFNEEARILTTLEKVVDYLSDQSYSWEVLVVDDGSSDSTAALVNQWAQTHQGVGLETIPHSGKGWAVKHGMLTATGEYRFMCDADLAMPIETTEGFLKEMREGYDIVIGSRQISGARRFNEPAIRHLMGRFFNWAVRLLAVGPFQDTQCGFKCFRGEIAAELFASQRTKGFGFDVEILYVALKREMRVKEIPIDWYHQTVSKLRPGVDSFLMLRDTLLVRWNDLSGRYGSRTEHKATAERNSAEESGAGTTPWPPASGMLAVVVPTYNEAANLPRLAERIFALGIPNTRLIVVDDNSPDGTAEVAKELAHKFEGRLDLIQRPNRQGLGTAYVKGFSHALNEGAAYVLQMDADLSHPPESIPALLEALKRADVVVGSRYIRGGGVDERWSLKRRMMSYLANVGIRMVAGLKVKDATSGFKAFRGTVLGSLNLTQLMCKGFGFQAEMAHACERQGYSVVEYPITFADRTEGRSKMSLSIALEALWRLLLLRWRR